MPRFSTNLPVQSGHKGFDLLRTPKDQPIRGVITCETLTVCDTHYWHGRTTPCERTVNEDGRTEDDSNCQACRMKHPWRTHCYVSAFDAKTHVHFLFECTDAAAEPLEAYFKANGTLRGCIFHSYRAKQSTNGKVTIVTSAADLTRIVLPKAPDVVKALCVLWRVPLTAANLDAFPAGRDLLSLDDKVLDMMHAGDEDGMDPAAFEAHRSSVLDKLAKAPSGNGHRKPHKIAQ